MADGLGVRFGSGFANFSVSANGILFYGRGIGDQKVRFAWRDRKGKVLEMIGEPFEPGVGTLRISPDQGRVAYLTRAADGQDDLRLLEFARGLSTRFTVGGARSPRWSPDGKQVYYFNAAGICRKAADGSGEEELVLGASNGYLGGVSPDGSYLLYDDPDGIWTLPLMGERKPKPYLRTKYLEGGAAFSPSGQWLAYESNESGRFEIYVQGFPERQGKWLVSADGGRFSAWRGDGKELYWVSEGRLLMAASMDLQPTLVRPGKPEVLFQMPSVYFAPARDGQRFLVLEPVGGTQPDPPMVVVQNWASRLGK